MEEYPPAGLEEIQSALAVLHGDLQRETGELLKKIKNPLYLQTCNRYSLRRMTRRITSLMVEIDHAIDAHAACFPLPEVEGDSDEYGST